MTKFEIEGQCASLQFSPDGRLLATVTIPHDRYGKDYFGTLRYWRAPSFEEIHAEIAATSSK